MDGAGGASGYVDGAGVGIVSEYVDGGGGASG